ncbi:hypothetical protein [Haloarcula amylolytica]|uniref:Putative peptidase inhibitor domain-containing protein n=1 Tax=Haloarcula amylolytica JCM 13557 TaxID=1227452 RepID=M0K8M3_9EURY|nr:hypothetical protein [Haloarcula amylolytica]EMA17173.1 hypothetical protein C442_17925 [Haloarcula amylolytica JCM 13557]
MAPYIQKEVAHLRDDATSGSTVTLVLGVADGAMADVKEQVHEAGATSIEELPFNSLQATLPETSVDRVCDIPGIESVELDSGMEVLAGN